MDHNDFLYLEYFGYSEKYGFALIFYTAADNSVNEERDQSIGLSKGAREESVDKNNRQ